MNQDNNQAEQFANLIRNLSKANYDAFIHCFIRNYFSVDEVESVDGPSDGGNDVRLYKNKKGLSYQIQITVQKSLGSKVIEDVKKAVENVKSFGASDTLHYFCTIAISNVKGEQLVHEARTDYSINLEIYDCNRIGQLLLNYRKCIGNLYALSGIPLQGKLALDVDEKERIHYDLISYGGEAAEIKNTILQSFIVNTLYENGDIPKSELYKELSSNFTFDDRDLFERQLARLSTEKRLKIGKPTEYLVNLYENEILRIERIKTEFQVQENRFHEGLVNILKSYNLVSVTEKFKTELRKFYKDCYQDDLTEILEGLHEDHTVQAVYGLVHFVDAYLNNLDKSKELVRDLIVLVQKNDFIPRICAGELFASISNPDRLQSYVNQIDKKVYLDTQIVLYLLCAYYEPIESNNPQMRSAVDLYNVFTSRKSELSVILFEEYIDEVAWHLLNAYHIGPFLDLDLYDEFGGSSNVFINYFRELKNSEYWDTDKTFDDFLLDIGFNLLPNSKDEFLKVAFEIVYMHLEDMGISVLQGRYYSKFQSVQDQFELEVEKQSKQRNANSIMHDVMMICHLAEKEEVYAEPYFISWDGVFVGMRKRIVDHFPNSRMWHLYSPARFINHISLLHFNVRSESLNEDFLAILEGETDIQSKVKSLLEVLSKIVDLRTEQGMRLVTKIKKLRKDVLYEQPPKPVKKEYELPDSPVDDILLRLTDHYMGIGSNFTIDSFRKVMGFDEAVDAFIHFLEKQTYYVKKNRDVDPGMYSEIDSILESFGDEESSN